MYPQLMQISIDEQKTTFFQAGENLSDKSHLWLIVDGVVKTYSISEEGTSITLGFWGKNDLVGKSLSNIRNYKAKCLSDVRAIAIEQAQWQSLSNKLIYNQQQTQQLMYIVHNARIAKRLWLLLIWLVDKFGKTIEQGKLIDFQLTHQELAEAIGTTRITVTKTLNQFEREGLILRPKTKCIIIKE